jgi:pimeloyl-ACP methyl ester carboxylesterase
MPLIEANSQRLHAEEHGQGAPALVFSHGLLMDREMFAPQVAEFARRHRCVTWDQRGHGLTEEDDKPFSYWDSARDCLAVMDALGIERAVLVGMSQGGFLALRAALLAPERVVGLVLIATQGGVDGEEVYDNFRGLKAEWSANGPLSAGPGLAQMLINAPEEDARWLEKWRAAPRARLGPCIDTLIARDDISGRLGEIACPALVIHGAGDHAIPEALGRKLAEALPDSRGFVSVPGAAHAPNLTHPAPVNLAIERFLAKL